MDQKLWLLVEWMDEWNIMFSNYDVVNTNRLLTLETDLHIGKVVFLRDRRNNSARKAQILRISDNKQYINELKVIQERQDNLVKNVLSLCMNTIKEMKTGPMENHDLNLTKSMIKFNNHQTRRFEFVVNGQVSRLLNDKSIICNRKSFVISTRLPNRDLEKTTVDKATQTDPIVDNRVEKILQIEEPVLDSQNTSVDPDGDNKASALKVPNLIRASAQTTSASLPMISYSGDMTIIGKGNVTLPANLLAKIDWTSYSAATRQLLQAVFPRRILATHSLTEKHSPAFVNKSLKKQLDPALVEYIVNIVSAKCGVPKRIELHYKEMYGRGKIVPQPSKLRKCANNIITIRERPTFFDVFQRVYGSLSRARDSRLKRKTHFNLL